MLKALDRDYVSHSAISTYQQCPLRYYFRYVANLPEELISAALVFGSGIHRAAEHHFEALLAGNDAPSLEALLETYESIWEQRKDDPIQFGNNETRQSLHELAKRMLTTFQASELATPKSKIWGIEEEMRGKVIEGCPDLLARVDLILATEKELQIIDLKTSRSRWKSGQAQNQAEQLLLYSELAKEMAPDKKLRLRFAVISKTKTPSLEMHDVSIHPDRVERTKRVVQRVWKAIQQGTFYPSPSPMACPSCAYQQACRDWQG